MASGIGFFGSCYMVFPTWYSKIAIHKPRFVEFPLSWALAPERRILVFMWSMGPLVVTRETLANLMGYRRGPIQTWGLAESLMCLYGEFERSLTDLAAFRTVIVTLFDCYTWLTT